MSSFLSESCPNDCYHLNQVGSRCMEIFKIEGDTIQRMRVKIGDGGRWEEKWINLSTRK